MMRLNQSHYAQPSLLRGATQTGQRLLGNVGLFTHDNQCQYNK